MPSVIAFGHASSGQHFRYGPKEFKADWHGTFRALDIAELAQKVAVPWEHGLGGVVQDVATNVATSPSKPWFSGAPEVAEDVKREDLLQRLATFSVNLDHMRITLEKGSRIRDERFIHVDSDVAEEVGEALVDMGINGWGYVREIVMALIKFYQEGDEDAPHRGLHVYFNQ